MRPGRGGPALLARGAAATAACGLALLALGGCAKSRCDEIAEDYGLDQNEGCGPAEARVTRAVDGDTVDLEDGTRVRYIGMNTPETSEAYYQEAKDLNASLVEGKRVQLVYDAECLDRYGRTLAYVCVDGEMVNELLVQACLAKLLTIPPNTAHRETLQQIWDDASAGCEKVCEAACN